jgi:hypothetical protein
MKTEQQGHVLTIEDGPGAQWVIAVAVPIAVGLFWMYVFNNAAIETRLGLGALGFVATFLALSVLRAPRTAEFNAQIREVRLQIGWLPLLHRHRTIPFTAIGKAEIWHPRPLINLGHFWPALVLHSGEWVALSGFPRPRARCAEVVASVERVISKVGRIV